MGNHRQIGEWIENRYQIFDIHVGGMGVVYVVYDHRGEAGHRVLALKTLRDEFLRDPRQVARFITECRAWVQLERHPNIVRAHAVQIIAGRPYIVLELVTGGNLRRWVGSPRLDVPTVLRFGIQFCLGMEHAVRKGLRCHRDIKPENLLITEGGTLKVTDFGLARVRELALGLDDWSEPIPLVGDEPSPPIQFENLWNDSGNSEPPSEPSRTATAAPVTEFDPVGIDHQDSGPEYTEPSVPAGYRPTIDWPPAPEPDQMATGFDTNSTWPTVDLEPSSANVLSNDLTVAGARLGTGIYMAPEQARDAKTVNVLADLYSFGVVLFEMLTLRPPFRAASYPALVRQHAEEPPPPLVPFIPARYKSLARKLERVVHHCLEKQPRRRFSSFADLRVALAELLFEATGERIQEPTEAELDAWELNSKGVSLGTLGRYEEELRSYEATFQARPDFVPPWFNRAAALATLGRLEEAVEYVEMALHLNAQSVPALINKGLLLYALRHPGEAIACFDTAVHLRPHDPDVWYGRSIVLQGVGNTEGARAALHQVHRLRPDDGPSVFGSARPIDMVAPLGSSDCSTRADSTATWLCSLPWVRRLEDTPSKSG